MKINLNHLSNKESIKTIITHEFEQLTHIDEDIDEIRNPKFTKEYYHELKKLYYKIKIQVVEPDFQVYFV